MLTFKKYSDVKLFKEETLTFLEKYQIENNLLLGVLCTLKSGEEAAVMATVKRDDELILVILQTHPMQMILSKPEPISDEEMEIIAEQFCHQMEDIPGLIGEKIFTSKLVEHISSLRDTHYYMHMDQRIYKLEHVKKEVSKDGTLRLIELSDLPLIKKWTYQFCEEVGDKISEQEAEVKTVELIERGMFHGWEVNGKLVSIANATRPLKKNITISFVFTPQEYRKKGYASNCVAGLSQKMLDQGYEMTSLYTDMANPTSNKIYMDIGYEPVMDSILFRKK
ncbi:GNAT family N-acetyltransferase [Pseudogracilibacillus auburnensis]|uniref:GNAT family N-acetyltransferase n=1 Tax=Pseudogracilibacillus auburnensis TaxID=1494959 RepID=UPI001A96D1E5|nr:GNAT family N-acetyltransferase [Pseudogracilibacillus auburnensis]MBO1005342.1 GNAT family N-acetyltransferase [Pseudogracilibacillus auburnensis]